MSTSSPNWTGNRAQVLRLLAVEDSLSGLELSLQELKKTGFKVCADLAQTPDEFTKQLGSNTYDVILADYRLPNWTGMDALALLKQLGKDIPFLLVTGTLGEETAVECIKQGVTDYVLKEHLARLPVAVHRALEEKAVREENARAEKALRESEAGFRLLFANHPMPMWVFDRESLKFLQVNDAAITHYGYGREEFLQMRITDIQPPEDVPRLLEVLGETHEPFRLTGPWSHRLKDGRIIAVEIAVHTLEFAGRPAALVVAQDITERKHAEAENARLITAIKQSAEGVLVTDSLGRIQYVNPAFTQITGYSREEAIGRNPRLLKSGQHDRLFYERLWKTILAGEIWRGEMTNRRKDGSLYTVEMSIAPVRNDRGEITHFIAIKEDITKRKRAEEELNRYFTLSDQMFCIAGFDGYFKRLNPAWEKALGFPTEELLAKPYLEFVHPEDRPTTVAEAQKLTTGADTVAFENRYLCADGSYRWLSWNSTPLPTIRLIYAAAQDITERKRAEEALRHSEARYRKLVENAIYGIYRATISGKFLDVNPALVEMLGYNSNADLFSQDLPTGIYRNAEDRVRILEQYRQTGRIDGVEVDWKRKDGTFLTVRLTGRAVADERGNLRDVEVIVEDVTERRAMERHLLQVRKFEAIGQLAGGVAHDFNNVIGAILGWAEIGQEQAPADSRLHTHFKKIREQAERAASLTRQLLAFARRQILEPRNINLNHVIEGLLSLLEKVISNNIELKTVLAPELDGVRADPTQVEQVLLNLCLNARDAMPNGGLLLIKTQNVVIDEVYCRSRSYARPGRYAVLSVCDTGVGMDAATREHMFEPFFTTKEPGKGTGLGLATVYGVVKQHGGFIHVYSEPRCGSNFQVLFPASSEAPAELNGKDNSGAQSVQGGIETILVAEDHDGVREVARTALEGLGYRVMLAEDGEEAVQVFSEYGARIALVLLDLVMPKMGGQEAYARMSAAGPHVPVLFATGYTTEAAKLSATLEKGVAILQKPYTPTQLGRKVREVLDRAASAAASQTVASRGSP